MIDAQDLADRYVAVWNESDPERRRRQIAALWVPDGQHYVDVREARGYDALEQRIIGSYNRNVRDGGHRFRARQDAQALRDIVVFHWEMLAAADDRVVAWGLVVLRVNDEGCTLVDYLFHAVRVPAIQAHYFKRLGAGLDGLAPGERSALASALTGWRRANERNRSAPSPSWPGLTRPSPQAQVLRKMQS